ncbi:MAG: hypothetical protein AAF497_25040 [Planctomycetota bacterium]
MALRILLISVMVVLVTIQPGFAYVCMDDPGVWNSDGAFGISGALPSLTYDPANGHVTIDTRGRNAVMRDDTFEVEFGRQYDGNIARDVLSNDFISPAENVSTLDEVLGKNLGMIELSFEAAVPPIQVASDFLGFGNGLVWDSEYSNGIATLSATPVIDNFLEPGCYTVWQFPTGLSAYDFGEALVTVKDGTNGATEVMTGTVQRYNLFQYHINVVEGPFYGKLTVPKENPNFPQLRYTHNGTSFEQDYFVYEIVDPSGFTETATVTLNIVPESSSFILLTYGVGVLMLLFRCRR